MWGRTPSISIGRVLHSWRASSEAHFLNNLCLPAQLVQRGRGAGAASIQLAVMLPLAYICFCAYYSLFKLGNFSFYRMVGPRAGREIIEENPELHSPEAYVYSEAHYLRGLTIDGVSPLQ